VSRAADTEGKAKVPTARAAASVALAPEPGSLPRVCRAVKRALVWIGTSGWVYKQWAGNFYPKGWPKKDEFGYYVRHFPTVEINATFYRLPSLMMVRGWHDKAPEGFVFAVKGSRYLTHIKRLKDTSAGLQKYFRRLVPLGDRTGPILWQLPPTFAKNDETLQRLERFLAKLPRRYQHAVEFRHPSWFDEQTFALLKKHQTANVWLSSLRMPADYTITAGFVYLRFHGLAGGAYHDYTAAELKPWAKELARAVRRGVPAYVYFNNDLNTRAPLNAHALMKLVERYAAAPKAADDRTPIREIKPPRRGPETWPAWTRRPSAARGAVPVPARGRTATGAAPYARATPPVPASERSRARPPKKRRTKAGVA
jgi:uncharacterized protein YecE (DUF72 family)